MNELISGKQEPTMSSREIAEITGKQHTNVIRDIREMIEKTKVSREKLKLVEVKDSRGYTSRFELDIFAAATLVSGYSSDARYEIIKRAGELAVREALQNIDFDSIDPDMFVYAMREVSTGKIKVGISKDPLRRMKQLQTGNSSELEIVSLQPAINGYEDEKIAQGKVKHLHIHGEWYEPEAIEILN